MVARLILDEDFSHDVIDELRPLGHDVMTASEAGRARQGIPDDQVLAFATAAGRAVLTGNRWHFVSLHHRNPVHAGIIVCSVDADYVALAARINAAIGPFSTLDGQLVRVNRPSR